MKIKILKKISMSMFITSLVTSCIFEKPGTQSSTASKPTPQNNGSIQTEQEQQNTPPEISCSPAKVIEILDNGSSAISVSQKDKRTLISWNILSRTIDTKLFFPVSYQSITTNGDYILRRVSFNKYQIIELNKQVDKRSKIIHVNSINTPEVKFSKNSKYLLINSMPFESNLKNEISVYDIDNDDYLSGIEYRFVKHFELTLDGQFLILGIDDGVSKRIIKIDHITNQVLWQVELPKLQMFTKLEVGEDTVIIQVGYSYTVYDLDTGTKKYDLSKLQLHGISESGKYSTFLSDMGKILFYHLGSGRLLYTKNVPPQIDFSSCKVNEVNMNLFCKNKADMNIIIGWDLAADISTSSCLLNLN